MTMRRPLFLSFCIVLFLHLRTRLSSFPHASFHRVEARALLCSSAATKDITLHPCICLSQQTSLLVLNVNRLFNSRVPLSCSESTRHALTHSKATFATNLRPPPTKWPTSRTSFHVSSTPVKRYSAAFALHSKTPASRPGFSDDRSRSALFPWIAPGFDCSTLTRDFTTSTVPSCIDKCNTLNLSNRNFGIIAGGSKSKGGSALCLSTRKLCDPSTCFWEKHPPVPTRVSNKSFFLNLSTGRFFSYFTSAARKLCRTPASTTCATTHAAAVPPTRNSFTGRTPTVKRSQHVFTHPRGKFLSVFPFPSSACTREVCSHLPPLQHQLVSCCSHTTRFPSLSSSHIPVSSYRPHRNVSRRCCWLVQHVSLRHTILETSRLARSQNFSRLRPCGDAGVPCGKRKHNGEPRYVERSCSGLLRAIPLLTGVVRSDSSKNAEIPKLLLPPLFTAVQAADSHHAQSILAFWKKPGVPRVGWTEDMMEMAHEQQQAARDSDIHSFPEPTGGEMAIEVQGRSRRHRIGRGESTLGSAPLPPISPSAASSLSITDALADQGEALLIMTGSSPTHLDTLGEAIVDALWEKHKRPVLGRDGRGFSGWVALSFMDLEVHIMTPITRQRYALEELYSLCPRIDVSDAVKIERLEGFEFMSGGIERFKPGGPPFDPEVDANYGLYE